MIEPMDNYVPLKFTRTEARDRQRCSQTLRSLRYIWRQLEDAGVQEQFRTAMMKMADDMKKALGGKEDDGYDDNVQT